MTTAEDALSARGNQGKIPCAIVLEDSPLGDDSRFDFTSFPEEITEGYASNAYREMGGNRLSQPGYAAYQGGDWAPFNLKLTLVAGMASILTSDIDASTLEQILIAMENQANWLIALQFPLERTMGVGQAERVLGVQRGTNPTSGSQVDTLANLPRNDPPIILVVFGAWKTIRGYVTSASWTWGPVFHPVTARPYQCEVSLTIKPQMAVIPTFNTIRGQPGALGFTTELVVDHSPALDAPRNIRDIDAVRQDDNAEAIAGLIGLGLGTVAGAALVAVT